MFKHRHRPPLSPSSPLLPPSFPFACFIFFPISVSQTSKPARFFIFFFSFLFFDDVIFFLLLRDFFHSFLSQSSTFKYTATPEPRTHTVSSQLHLEPPSAFTQGAPDTKATNQRATHFRFPPPHTHLQLYLPQKIALSLRTF